MASNTARFGLLKKDPIADGNDTFNIQTMLNDNWDKLDEAAKKSELDAHSGDYVKHPGFGITTNTNSDYAVTLNPAPTSYVDGMAVSIKINADSTGASTLNVNGLGAIPLKKANGNDVTNLKANGVYTFRYNSSTGNFILQGEGGEYGTATAADVLQGKTIGTESGVVAGTIPNNGAGGTVTPGTTNQTKPAGYYSSQITILGDSNLKAANIKQGVTIFGVTGNLRPWNGEKQRASGNTTSSSSTLTFEDTVGGLVGKYYIEITGLTFLPSIIIVYYPDYHTVENIVYNANNIINSYPAIGIYYSTGYEAYKMGRQSAYVNSTGFRLPVYGSGAVCTWIAYE